MFKHVPHHFQKMKYATMHYVPHQFSKNEIKYYLNFVLFSFHFFVFCIVEFITNNIEWDIMVFINQSH